MFRKKKQNVYVTLRKLAISCFSQLAALVCL